MFSSALVARKHGDVPRERVAVAAARSVTSITALALSIVLTWPVVAQDVVISEILASNGSGLRDDDGEYSDWIEIENRGESTQDLAGWHLTDDPLALSMWRFPAIELAPGEAIIVFASGKNRASSGAPLHASFNLDREGEFLALVRPDGKTIAHALSPQFPPQRHDISYGLLDGDSRTFVYLLSPTPGAPNGGNALLGFVPNVVPSVAHGFFDEPFDVSLASADPAAEIRFTLDGSVPVPGSSPLYEEPIRIQKTTILRARAFRDGYGPSDVMTRSYIFPEQVVRQTGAGFPPTWGGVAADYEMDPNVVNAPAYRDTIVEDLLTIPTLSIVLPVEDLFGPRGIYSNTEGRGPLWERACSIELVHPDGSEGFQVDCGIRIFGYGWRPHSATMKHSFRLVFSSDYGPGKLRHPFFPGWPVEVFDDIVLRSQGSRGWNDFRESIIHTQYIRDAWARHTARDMGKLTTQSTYVHLYLNGLYWGLYNPVERPDAQFLVHHLGGEREDYDALNARVGVIEVIDGTRAAWDRVMALSRSDVTRPEVWDEIRELVDLPDLVNYMLVQFYTGNRDWPGSNGNNMRVAGGPDVGIGFKSFLWDMEYSIWEATDNVLNVATQYDTPATLHARLRSNLEYRTLFGDLAHRHLTGDGALTPERAAARWLDRAQEIDRAIVGESARWGDRRREPPYTRDVEWVRERDRLLSRFFPQRTGVLLEQLRAASLYPRVDAPQIEPEGGLVATGTEVVLSAPLGQVYYTLDGSDPRLPGGGVAPSAHEFGTAHRTLLLPEGADGRFFVPTDDSLENDWFAVDFDDSAWRPVTLGVGFDRSSGYEDHIVTDIGDDMFRVNSSAWLRVSFDIDESGEELEIERLFLRAKFDDGFCVWLNGEPVTSRNAPEPIRWNSQATASHGDAAAIVFEDIEVSDAASLLRPGRNVLAVQLLNTSQANADLLFSVELEGSAPSAPGEAIVIERSTRLLARALLGGQWSALEEAVFVTGETPPLRITEIFYHPPDDLSPTGFEADDYEWIEIQNIGAVPWDARGTRLDGGVRFEFPRTDPAILGPGEIALVVKSEAAFHSRYGVEAKILGEYEGRLSNAGDRVVLEGAFGEPIHDFSYLDTWYPETDGQGASLEVIDRTAPLSSWSLREHWRPSDTILGTPGQPIGGEPLGGLVLPSDANGDGQLDLSDPVRVLAALFLGEDSVFPCDDGTISSAGNTRVLDANGDAALHLSDAVYVLTYLFQGGPPPVEGTACVRIEGCPNVCAN